MIRRPPIIPTIVVAAAVAVMIWLGIWQLQRARWKEGLLANMHAAEQLPPIAYPTMPMNSGSCHCSATQPASACALPASARRPAKIAAGEPGYVQIVDCATGAEGPGMSVEVGWSKDPNAKVNWSGGPVSGIIVPDRRSRMRLVAASAPPGLEPTKTPDVSGEPDHPCRASRLCGDLVQLGGHRAGDLWIGPAQAAEGRGQLSGERHVLANGLTVAVDPLPGAESVSLGLYASVGSRSEPRQLGGLAHLVEHMVFKGAGGRDTRALAEVIEDVGGSLNAWTARDQTVFHGRALAATCRWSPS